MRRRESEKRRQSADVQLGSKHGVHGEMTVLDLTAMNVPPVSVVTNGGNFLPGKTQDATVNSGITNVDVIVCNHEENNLVSSPQPLPWENLCHYICDGGESSVTYLPPLGNQPQETKF
ncbi:uncharacterized protein [Macrobrachium rosenbergii]|uniref:uncharacterized protein n=1 Tax=Macrobrachium rosenbergii TaxID=79674 RepID=UPI0034D71E5A